MLYLRSLSMRDPFYALWFSLPSEKFLCLQVFGVGDSPSQKQLVKQLFSFCGVFIFILCATVGSHSFAPVYNCKDFVSLGKKVASEENQPT